MKDEKGGLKIFRILILFILVLYIIGALAQMKWHPVDAFSFWLKMFGYA